MKSVVLIAALVGAGAGVLSSVVIGLTNTQTQETSLTPLATQNVDEIAFLKLADQVEELTETNKRLTERLSFLEQRPRSAGAPADARVSAVESVALEEQVADLKETVAALTDNDRPVPANFTQRVSQALDDIREQEEAERDQRRWEAQMKQIDERVTKLTDELGLAQNQAKDMRIILTDELNKMNELRTSMRETGDWGSGREKFREVRDATKTALSNVLSPDQMEKYEESGNDRWGRGGGGGDRDRRGGGGGGPGGGGRGGF